jgi:hypothetical protein
LSFGWFTHKEQRKVARSFTDKGLQSSSEQVRARTGTASARYLSASLRPTGDDPIAATTRPRQCDLAHGFNPAFTYTAASPERTHSSQIVLEIKGWVMTKFQFLQEQAARAERLARSILDAVTAERLQAFAAECRAKAKTLDELQVEAA